jgi:hypothetical protein
MGHPAAQHEDKLLMGHPAAPPRLDKQLWGILQHHHKYICEPTLKGRPLEAQNEDKQR